MATLFDMEPPVDAALQMNDAQRRAIHHGEGPLLVIAGAGTGKTRVITERIRHLLESDASLSGENILGLTFTNKAAGEMKARVVRVLGERGKKVTLATFHSFCESLLKDAAPGRLMMDKVDHWVLLRRNLARLQLDKYRRLAEPGQFLNDFVEFFSRCQDELVSAEDYQRYADDLGKKLQQDGAALDADTFKERAEVVALQQEITRAYRASEALLREKQRVSFGSLITGAVESLETNSALRNQLQQRFRYILVDEFQDTNIAQLRLLELLANENKSIMAVGDNDQAIYRFRGASFGSFKLFLERFTGWREGRDSTPFRVSLVENYRSTPNILRVATQVIAQNTVSADFPKKVLNANKKEGEKIRIVELANEEEEARWVASELERIHASGRPWRDFAILYRQHAHRDKMVEELSRRRIPFVISNLSILEHPLVKDILAYLRLIAAPSDDISCARILAVPAWGLDAAQLVRLGERAKKEKKALYDLLQEPQGRLPFDTSSAAPAKLLEFIAEQRKALRQRSARDIVDNLIEWLEIPQRASPRDRTYVTRLVEFAKEWGPKSESRGLAEFVEYLDYYSQAGGAISLADDAPGDAVQLMTVHAAKGLEFPQVFLLRVNNKKFPAAERPRVFEFPVALMKEGEPAEQFHIQEERRLFYVALTRAENRLTLTTITEKQGKTPVFVEDILLDPGIKRRDVRMLSPKIPQAAPSERKSSTKVSDAGLFPVAGPAKIFSRIADWALEFHPPTPEPLTLSPSAVSGYRSCPQRYLFGRSWSLKEGPRAVLTFGNVMHTTIKRLVEQLRKGTKLPFDELARIYDAEWSSAGFEDDYQEQAYKEDGLEQLRAVHASLVEAPPNVLYQERGFELPLEDNVTIIGRMDQVNSLGRNDVEIVDYKTGKPKKEAEARKDLQLSLYALAAKGIFDWNPVRLVFHYLQNNERQATTRDTKQLDEAQKTVLEAAADIRAGNFAPNPGFVCRSCAFQPICPAHEEALSS